MHNWQPNPTSAHEFAKNVQRPNIPRKMTKYDSYQTLFTHKINIKEYAEKEKPVSLDDKYNRALIYIKDGLDLLIGLKNLSISSQVQMIPKHNNIQFIFHISTTHDKYVTSRSYP